MEGLTSTADSTQFWRIGQNWLCYLAQPFHPLFAKISSNTFLELWHFSLLTLAGINPLLTQGHTHILMYRFNLLVSADYESVLKSLLKASRPQAIIKSQPANSLGYMVYYEPQSTLRSGGNFCFNKDLCMI